LKKREEGLRAGGISAASNEPTFQAALTELCLALFNANEFMYTD
jgi:hypothetical protein